MQIDCVDGGDGDVHKEEGEDGEEEVGEAEWRGETRQGEGVVECWERDCAVKGRRHGGLTLVGDAVVNTIARRLSIVNASVSVLERRDIRCERAQSEKSDCDMTCQTEICMLFCAARVLRSRERDPLVLWRIMEANDTERYTEQMEVLACRWYVEWIIKVPD